MARQFVADHGEGDATPPPSGETRAPAAPRPPAAGIADKLRGHADSMQAKIDDCFRDRDTNTPRKARMAAGARIDGTQWERRSEEHTSELQSLMRNSYAVFCSQKKQK